MASLGGETSRTDLPPLPRPHSRWCHATSWLDSLCIVTWAVDPATLAALLPVGFSPLTRSLGDGNPRGLVSMVGFRDRDFHFNFAPWLPIGCGQVNYRAYVEFNGQSGVWFFGTSLDNATVAVPRAIWGMPWHRGWHLGSGFDRTSRDW